MIFAFYLLFFGFGKENSDEYDQELPTSLIDVFPPMYLEENGTIHTWSLFGKARVYEDYIQLVPKIKRAKGAMWTNAVLPPTNWTVAFDLVFENPNEDFSFGIFYTQEASSDRSFHGGPSRFAGMAVLGKFWRHDNKYVYFDINSVQSDGKLDMRTFPLRRPDARFKFEDSISFGIQIAFVNEKIIVLFDKMDGSDPITISQEEQLLNYTNFYLGIAGKNTGFASSMNIYQIQCYGISDKVHSMSNFASPDGPAPFGIDDDYVYKNAAFKEITKAKIIGDKFNYDPKANGMFEGTNSDTVLTAIDELVRANFDVASYNDINTNISNSLSKAVQNLSKRINKVVKSINAVNSSLGLNYLQTKSAIDNFNSSLHSVFQEILQVSFNATSELMAEDNESFLTGEETSHSPVIKLLYLVGILEIVVVGFILYLSNKNTEPIYSRLPF